VGQEKALGSAGNMISEHPSQGKVPGNKVGKSTNVSLVQNNSSSDEVLVDQSHNKSKKKRKDQAPLCQRNGMDCFSNISDRTR